MSYHPICLFCDGHHSVEVSCHAAGRTSSLGQQISTAPANPQPPEMVMTKLFWRFGYLKGDHAFFYQAWFVDGGRWIRMYGRFYMFYKDKP